MTNGLRFAAPIGDIGLVEEDGALTAVLFAGQPLPADCEVGETPLLIEARRQLEEYFGGARREFSLPLAPAGTEFQKKVWAELRAIPYGETRAYGQIARAIGNEKASRAVGLANGRNPIPIIIPCHRVVGTNGKLVGFGGGLDVKAKLLALEKG